MRHSAARYALLMQLSLAVCCLANVGCSLMGSCGSSCCDDCTATCGVPEAGCGCEDFPSCGCPEPAGCGCADVGCDATCGCPDASCGCPDASCGCPDASCGCPDSCTGGVGCGSGCSKKSCPLLNCNFIKSLFGCGGCAGCSNEVYWSEWNNDPPCDCDPCDCYGNYTGQGGGYYRAPYQRRNGVAANASAQAARQLDQAPQEVAGIPSPPNFQ